MGWFSRKAGTLDNTSGLVPAGHAVLLQPYEPEFKASALVIPDIVRRRTAMVEMRATVIAVGNQTWRQEARLWGLLARPRARVGDRVIVSAYCGAIVQGPADGKQYRMVNDEDVFCRITAQDAQVVQTAGMTRLQGVEALRAAGSEV